MCESPNDSIGARYVSPAVVAEKLGMSQKTVLRHIHDGIIPATRVGRLLRVNLDELDRLLSQQKAAA